jgi:TetR/AcrR family transcriptional regulator, cholesterol catabolism regulator
LHGIFQPVGRFYSSSVATGQIENRSRRGTPGRPPFHDNQRDRVVACAAELFAREGFENVGMERLADAVGISKAGIYHYFGAKHEILDAIVVATLDGLIDAVTDAVEKAPTPRRRLVAFMTAHAAYFEANYWSFTAMLVGFGGIRSPARGAVVEQRDHYESLLRQIIADGIESGDFRRVDLSTASRAALSMLNWMVRWFDPSGPERAADLAAAYVELLLDGIRADTRLNA